MSYSLENSSEVCWILQGVDNWRKHIRKLMIFAGPTNSGLSGEWTVPQWLMSCLLLVLSCQGRCNDPLSGWTRYSWVRWLSKVSCSKNNLKLCNKLKIARMPYLPTWQQAWKYGSSNQLPNYFILSCSCSCIAFWTRKMRKPQNIQLKHIVAVWCLSIKLNLQKVKPLIHQISLQTNQSKPCPSCLLRSFICLFPSLERLEPQTLTEGMPPVSSINSINCVVIMVTTRMKKLWTV